ncbi:hypothetical protein ANO11243_012860 [Dothideomycetidae sp. 11243]|nr:hypothetical protein ANO11243_012860 [fungal sp. No.11243]
MAKDKKAKAAQKKARVAAKTEKKTAQKEKKSKTKSKNDDSDSDEGADLDAILAQYAAAQEQFLRVTEIIQAEPPRPRSSATLIANPADAREVLLFGGESIVNGLASFSNELNVYRPATDQWRLVTSPNSPLPRSGHAVCRGANTPCVYLFGGEFSSPRQGTFHHYNDFWRLECAPDGREWTRLETKGPSPSARSGHRMVAYKRYVILFGGFQDTSASTRYLNDLWIYDTQTFAWHEPKLSTAVVARPDARSSFSFLPHDAGAVVVGGYSRVKATAGGGSASKKGKSSGGGAGRVVMKPVVHTDSWLVRVVEPPKDSPEKTPPTVRWERRKKPVNYPAPSRAGATMAHHRGRGILFGGVHDVEDSEEGIDSEFFNQLWAYNVERNRFFPLALRRPRATNNAKRPAQAERAKRGGRAKADEEELLRNLALIEGKGGDQANGDASASDSDPDSDEDEPAVEKPVQYELPHARFNAQLAVQGDTLFLYGGTFEKGDREFTFDELWALDLGKLDGIKEMFRRELEDWAAADSDSDDDDEDDDEEEDEEDDSDNEEGKEPSLPITVKDEPPPPPAADEQEDPEPTPTSADDGKPYPQPFESLRAFYARTTNEWQLHTMRQAETGTGHDDPRLQRSAKEVKKDAFAAAETRWWDVREEVALLEEERERGGVGEVVHLVDREGTTGAGRRR